MSENESHLEEHVLVIQRKLLEEIGIFQGLMFDMEKYRDILQNPKRHSFRKRNESRSMIHRINSLFLMQYFAAGTNCLSIGGERSREKSAYMEIIPLGSEGILP